jgi:putative FmdB family regulatory protein
MPTYEYKCDHCNKKFELFQKITEEPIAKCPSCGARAQRLFGTGSGFIFKGSGFYATDYRSESYRKREKEEKDAQTSKKDTPPKTTNTNNNK